MKYRIKDLTIHSYRCFNTGSDKVYDRIESHNEAIMRKLFNDLQDGTIKGFYLVSDKEFKLYHISTKQENRIQYSYGFYREGQLIPCGDCQFETFKDLLREGYSNGTYETI